MSTRPRLHPTRCWPVLTTQVLAAVTGLLLGTTHTVAQDLTFAIQRFDVQGNTLLPATDIAPLLTEFTGPQRRFADVQLAQEKLERAYRLLGYSAVAVTLPEQDISAGVVRFEVVEARLGRIVTQGHRQFSADNVRRSLPSLQEGAMPQASRLAENVSLANENPAKRTEVTLKLSQERGVVDADVTVDEDPITRWIATLDNSGDGSPGGDYRVSLAWQHANLFDRDQVFFAQYTTSVTHPQDVAQWNLGYHIPLYSWGHSVDVFAGHSNLDAGNLAGNTIQSFVGKGQIAGVRYNQHLPRQGEYSHHLKYGWDWKRFDNQCTGPACLAIGADVSATPWSVGYHGDWTRPGAQTTWNLTYLRNSGSGSHNTPNDYLQTSHQPGTFGATRDYSVWRLQFAQLNLLPHGFQSRIQWNAQYSADALIPGEQLGLTGLQQVRGFREREWARDRGHVLNLELYTPDWSAHLPWPVGQARAVLFVDHAQGRFVRNAQESSSGQIELTSAGFGLRLAQPKQYQMRLDLARAVQVPAGTPHPGWKAHFLWSGMF